MMRGKGFVATRIKLVCNLVDEIPERRHGLDQIQKGSNEHKKLPFGTLLSSASADDKQVSAMWQWKFLVGVFCILTINPKAPPKYLNDLLKKSHKSAAVNTEIEKSCRRRHQPQKKCWAYSFF